MYSATFGGRAGRSKKSGPKSKKVKCVVCGAKGHAESACPKKPDSTTASTGTSTTTNYNKPSSVGGAGSGITHKTSRKANSSTNNKKSDDTVAIDVIPPNNIISVMDNNNNNNNNNNPYIVFDAGCNVGASIDQLAMLLKAPEKKCIATYKAAISLSSITAPRSVPYYYAGSICRHYIKATTTTNTTTAATATTKPWSMNTPRVVMMMDADPHVYFVVGLGAGFLQRNDDSNGHEYDSDSSDDDENNDDDDSSNDKDNDNENDIDNDNDECNNAKETLIYILHHHPDRIVGFCAKLDSTRMDGTNMTTQLLRLKVTCAAAIQAGVPIQIEIVANNNNNSTTTTSNEHDNNYNYNQLIKELAKILLQMSPTLENDTLKVHLACWSGSSDTLLKLLQAFPNNLYIGMNATVGFSKATVAHECAFDVPLNRLLLETDNVIPAPVTKAMGRKAFSHCGLVSYCAAAVAEQKKISVRDVAKAASENTVRLYGTVIAERAKEALAEAEAKLASEDPQEETVVENTEEQEQQMETNKQVQKKKKTKTKKGGADQGVKKCENTEGDFDDGILESMLRDSSL